MAVAVEEASVDEGTFAPAETTVRSIPGNRRLAARVRPGAHAFRLVFAVPAALISLYATVLSGDIIPWQTAAAYWVFTLLVVYLVARIASMIERCEREAAQDGGPVAPRATGRRSAQLRRSTVGAEERLAHLERVIVRQHRFVSDAAHELRTPLTAQSLVGENVLAQQVVAGAELREAIVSMLEESKHMKRLIEGLLDITRASLTRATEQGASRQPTAMDLSALVLDCVESLRVLAEEKQQSIELNVAAQLWADADLTMVRQALLNVIHNSIEHCPEGTHIRVETERCSSNEGLIRVQDNGPGIPLQEQHCVFERFYRGSGASRQRSLGLGLSIAKAILCSQGGGIELQSGPGTGACFNLTLPLMRETLIESTGSAGRDSDWRTAHRQTGGRKDWAILRLAGRQIRQPSHAKSASA